MLFMNYTQAYQIPLRIGLSFMQVVIFYQCRSLTGNSDEYLLEEALENLKSIL
jgi:hypothetical protein